MLKVGLLLAEKMIHPSFGLSHAVLHDYHGRLLVLSKRFDEACVMLRKAFDVYPEQTTGFRACGQLLMFCTAYRPRCALQTNCTSQNRKPIRKVLDKCYMRQLAKAFRTAEPFNCQSAWKRVREHVEPSLHVVFLKWITRLENDRRERIKNGEKRRNMTKRQDVVTHDDSTALNSLDKERLSATIATNETASTSTDKLAQLSTMRQHAEHLLLSVYALEIESAWDDGCYKKLDEIYENARILRGTTFSAFARGLLNEFRGRRLLLFPRVPEARQQFKEAAETYELCESVRCHLCVQLGEECAWQLAVFELAWGQSSPLPRRAFRVRSGNLRATEVLKNVFDNLSHKECHRVQKVCRWFRAIIAQRLNEDHAAWQYKPPDNIKRVTITRQSGQDGLPDNWDVVIFSLDDRQITASGDHHSVFKFVQQVCYRERPLLVIKWNTTEPLDHEEFVVLLNDYWSAQTTKYRRLSHLGPMPRHLPRRTTAYMAFRNSLMAFQASRERAAELEHEAHERDIFVKLAMLASDTRDCQLEIRGIIVTATQQGSGEAQRQESANQTPAEADEAIAEHTQSLDLLQRGAQMSKRRKEDLHKPKPKALHDADLQELFSIPENEPVPGTNNIQDLAHNRPTRDGNEST